MKKRVFYSIIILLFIGLAIIFSIAYGPKDDSQMELNKTYCEEEQRNVGACIEIYEPVCGMPLNETFSNSCFACSNSSVEYYLNGEC